MTLVGQAGTPGGLRKSDSRVVSRLDRVTDGVPFPLVTESVVTARCSGHTSDAGAGLRFAACYHPLLVDCGIRGRATWRIPRSAVTMFSRRSFKHIEGEVRE
jgi:hypothetical protein